MSEPSELDLSSAHKIVASWPQWKQDLAKRILGPSHPPAKKEATIKSKAKHDKLQAILKDLSYYIGKADECRNAITSNAKELVEWEVKESASLEEYNKLEGSDDA